MVVMELVVLRQGFAKHYGGGGGVGGGRGLRQGKGEAPMCLPTIYRGGGAGFLPSKSIGALAKVGGRKNPIISFLTDCYPPFLGILILSLRDMILFLLREDLGAP